MTEADPAEDRLDRSRPSMATVLREWGRIGCVGFGGPPTHIRLLRELCVDRKRWIGAVEFEDAIAACNLLPGPASTQLSIFCAWRVRGRLGAVVGGLAFIVPGLIVILALAALFLAEPTALGAGGRRGRWCRGGRRCGARRRRSAPGQLATRATGRPGQGAALGCLPHRRGPGDRHHRAVGRARPDRLRGSRTHRPRSPRQPAHRGPPGA